MNINTPETFTLLNFNRLQQIIHEWIENYPKLHFTKISLYQYTPKLATILNHYNFVFGLVFEVLDCDRFTQQFEQFRSDIADFDKRKIFSLIGNSLANAYITPPSPSYDFWQDWSFYLITVNRLGMSSYYVTASDNLISHIQTQKDHWVLFENEQLRGENDSITFDRPIEVLSRKIDALIRALHLPKNFNRLDLDDRLRDFKVEYEIKLHEYIIKYFDLTIKKEQAHLLYTNNNNDQPKFIEEGETFFIYFNEIGKRLKKTKGLNYIHYLIKNKDKVINKNHLYNEYNPAPEVNNPKFIESEINNPVYKEEGEIERDKYLNYSNFFSQCIEDSPDLKAVKEYKKELKSIEQELEQAKDNHDLAMIEKLENDKKAIIKELKKYHYSKNYNDPISKNVGKAIKKAINNVKLQNPELADHLKEAIPQPYASKLKYNPDSDLEWITE